MRKRREAPIRHLRRMDEVIRGLEKRNLRSQEGFEKAIEIMKDIPYDRSEKDRRWDRGRVSSEFPSRS